MIDEQHLLDLCDNLFFVIGAQTFAFFALFVIILFHHPQRTVTTPLAVIMAIIAHSLLVLWRTYKPHKAMLELTESGGEEA